MPSICLLNCPFISPSPPSLSLVHSKTEKANKVFGAMGDFKREVGLLNLFCLVARICSAKELSNDKTCLG